MIKNLILFSLIFFKINATSIYKIENFCENLQNFRSRDTNLRLNYPKERNEEIFNFYKKNFYDTEEYDLSSPTSNNSSWSNKATITVPITELNIEETLELYNAAKELDKYIEEILENRVTRPKISKELSYGNMLNYFENNILKMKYRRYSIDDIKFLLKKAYSKYSNTKKSFLKFCIRLMAIEIEAFKKDEYLSKNLSSDFEEIIHENFSNFIMHKDVMLSKLCLCISYISSKIFIINSFMHGILTIPEDALNNITFCDFIDIIYKFSLYSKEEIKIVLKHLDDNYKFETYRKKPSIKIIKK